MELSLYIGLAATLLVIVILSVWSGSRAKKDQRNGMGVVAGVITGTLVGGSSTVGTAQLAYHYGLSAWWFTLGGGIACLMLSALLTARNDCRNLFTGIGYGHFVEHEEHLRLHKIALLHRVRVK